MKSNKNSSQYLQKLLSSIAKKQKNALQQLFDSEAESMMTLARQSLVNEQSAKKVLLKTFVIIWENADSYSAEMGSARGWLYSVLRHQIREYYTENYQTLALTLAKEAAFKPLGMREVQEELNPEINAEETFHYYFEQLTQEQQSSLLTVYLSPDVQAVSATRMGIALARLSEDISIGLHHLARSLPHLPRHEEGLILGEFVLGGMSDSALRQAYEIIDRLEDSTRIILLWEELFTEFIAQLQPCSLEPSTWKSLNDKLKELHHQQKELERKKYDSAYEDGSSEKNIELQEKAAALAKDGKKMPISLRLHFLWHSVKFWQGLGITCLLFALVILFRPSSSNTLRWVAVLSDRSANPTAGWTMKIKDNGQALITPSYQQIGQSNVDLKLWSSKDKGQTMHAITTLDTTTSNIIDLSALGDIQPQQIFYISLEPKGGSSANRPSGSILYQGPVVNLNEE
jgi:RNA polymerase sigma-70 factor (ECF subfamily)